MNTLKIEAKLAEKYKYKNLPDDLSRKYRIFWIENIPAHLKINGAKVPLFTINGSPICEWYDRIVVGDYGAFIEFKEDAIVNDFVVAPWQGYRIYDERYNQRVKYHWLTIDDNSEIKIYKQVREVSYADYKVNRYYISVHEAFTMECIAESLIENREKEYG